MGRTKVPVLLLAVSILIFTAGMYLRPWLHVSLLPEASVIGVPILHFNISFFLPVLHIHIE
tara:strand:- start:1230 stop:1412 length:183 start_codon:yes stop_codon:yes gene_type:complete